MSRAFVKEADDKAPEDFPERAVSDHPNFVTARGLQLIEEAIRELERERDQAKLADDTATLARINRDLRYWQQRKASAKLVTPEASPTKVRFGVIVTLSIEDGSERSFTLVGEDEADPQSGLLSWTSPVAQALFGRETGDDIVLQGSKAEIVRIAAPIPSPYGRA